MKKKYWTLLIVGVLVVALVIVLASCGNFSLKDKDLDEDEEMEDLADDLDLDADTTNTGSKTGSTGGNSGTQASVAVIRALSLGEVDFSDVLAVLWKEVRVAFLCGAALAAANFVKMQLVDRALLGNSEVTMAVCLVVCLTVMFVVIFAKCVGCSLPLLAEKIGLDPAVMASP